MAVPWKELVESLKRSGFQSPYLDRLSARMNPKQLGVIPRGIEAEILEEMAAALCRAEDKVNAALLELDVLEQGVRRAADAGERERAVEAFNRKRDDALNARWELLVHREAVGFYRNEILAELYPVPPP